MPSHERAFPPLRQKLPYFYYTAIFQIITGRGMSIASQSTRQKFPYSYDSVFDGLLKILPAVEMKVKTADKVIGRITASAGMSLLSWGENVSIVVERDGDLSTIVGIDSSLKMGTNIAGAHRHQKNFDKIIFELSRHLQTK
jgi:hypothetical protein